MKYNFYVAFIGTLGQELNLGMFKNRLLMTIGLFEKGCKKSIMNCFMIRPRHRINL